MPIDTINDLTPRVQYVASAAQTDFDYPFPIFADGDLVVDVDGVTQVLATDYTVAGEGDDTGGTVTFLSGMAGNEVVTIYRDMSIERTTDFSQNGAFSSSAFNDELDRITLVQQDLAQQVRRSLRIPMTAEVTDAQAELSPLSNWLGKYVYINASGVPEPASVLSTGVTFTQATIGETLWPISTAETSAGLVAADLNEHYPYGHILRYGTNSTPGTTSMSVAMQAAVDQFEQGGAVPYVPKEAGVCNFSASVVLPNLAIKIVGNGATLTTTGALANGIFYQTNRGVLTEIEGFKCTGASPLFRRYALDSPLPWSDHYLEYRITRCVFAQAATSYAAYFYGAREGSFAFCHFETCKGVYSDYSINMEFIGCTGKNAVQFVDAQAGSEGIKFIGGTALGMTYCIKATNMIGIQIDSVMWDYNDNPVSLTACQQIGIVNSYITCRSTTAHVINIVPDGATRSEDIYIVGNPMIANVADSGTGRGIHIEDADYVTISCNQVKLWRDVGIYLDNCTQGKVMDNNIIPFPGVGNHSVQTVTADSSIVIENNTVVDTVPITTVSTRAVRFNRGFVTENAGEATFTAGATTRTVAHGLDMTPLKQDIRINTTSTLGTATEIWVSAVDATNITLATDVDPVTNVTVAWAARISPG
jgi:parallel beta-helix repeat protein